MLTTTLLTITSRCWLCQQSLFLPRHGICCVCLRSLTHPPSCPRCGLPALHPRLACGRCLLRAPVWDAVVYASDYQPPLSTLVKKYKWGGMPELAYPLARLLLLSWLRAYRQGVVVKPDYVLAVPLHQRRCWRRGFNQSDLLARLLAHWMGCRYEPLALQRCRATASQQRLNAVSRRRNLRGAFQCHLALHGQHVALLDDVVTTGSTVAEICRVLKASGAASIQILCLCRTL